MRVEYLLGVELQHVAEYVFHADDVVMRVVIHGLFLVVLHDEVLDLHAESLRTTCSGGSLLEVSDESGSVFLRYFGVIRFHGCALLLSASPVIRH